jgi:hypothetical protein
VTAGIGGALVLGWGRRRHFPVLRWLLVTTGIGGVALTYFQATRRAPALPVALSVLVTVLGGGSTIGLIVRIVAGSRRGPPPPPGAYVALAGAAAAAAGGYASMRQEAGTDPRALGPLETITLQS